LHLPKVVTNNQPEVSNNLNKFPLHHNKLNPRTILNHTHNTIWDHPDHLHLGYSTHPTSSEVRCPNQVTSCCHPHQGPTPLDILPSSAKEQFPTTRMTMRTKRKTITALDLPTQPWEEDPDPSTLTRRRDNQEINEKDDLSEMITNINSLLFISIMFTSEVLRK
jgi:hypothetical protein